MQAKGIKSIKNTATNESRRRRVKPQQTAAVVLHQTASNAMRNAKYRCAFQEISEFVVELIKCRSIHAFEYKKNVY